MAAGPSPAWAAPARGIAAGGGVRWAAGRAIGGVFGRVICGGVGACLIVAGGCESNPFALHEKDYGAKVTTDRLRELRAQTLQEFRKPDGSSPETVESLRARYAGLKEVELSIEECRAAAFEHNLDIRTAVIDPAAAAEVVSQEEARFESLFTLRTSYRELDSPTSSQLASGQSKGLNIEPGVRVPLITGGDISVSLPVTQNENDNSFSTLNPAYTSDLQFSISHQLLRNAGRRANTAALRIAGYNRQASEAQTQLELIRQLAAVDRAYWRLYQARGELQVRVQQYEVAQAQLDRSKRRLNAGAVSEIEVVRAQAGASDRLEAIIIAQNAVLDRQRELKRVVNMPGLEVDTMTVVAPRTTPDPVEYQFDRPTLVSQAVSNRMEMLELELRLAADAATIALNKNRALPLLTLDYTYRINGLGGSMQDTFRTLERNRFEDWEVGLAAEIPLGNEQAKARIRESILRRLARLGTKEARALAIRQETLGAIDAIEAGWQRILAARQSAVLNARALQAEQRQFDVGTSTSTNVLDAAARLADAQSAEVRALTDYQIAQIDLAFATGTLLGQQKIRWEPAPRPDSGSEAPAEEIPSMVNEALGRR